MNILFLAALLLAFSRVSICGLLLFQAVSPPGENIFSVSQNTVALFTWTGESYCSAKLISNGRTNYAGLNAGLECALVGPVELRFPTGGAIQFRTFTNSGFSSFTITNGQSATISVPERQVVRFLPSVFGAGALATLSNGTGSTPQVSLLAAGIAGSAQYEGPASITFYYPFRAGEDPKLAKGFAYYFADASTPLPSGVVIQASAGKLELRVEKSSDLKQWSPSIIHELNSEEKLFYRLNFNR
jgi:hypothetical protein